MPKDSPYSFQQRKLEKTYNEQVKIRITLQEFTLTVLQRAFLKQNTYVYKFAAGFKKTKHPRLS